MSGGLITNSHFSNSRQTLTLLNWVGMYAAIQRSTVNARMRQPEKSENRSVRYCSNLHQNELRLKKSIRDFGKCRQRRSVRSLARNTLHSYKHNAHHRAINHAFCEHRFLSFFAKRRAPVVIASSHLIFTALRSPQS